MRVRDMKRPGRKFEIAKNRRRLRKARMILSRYCAERGSSEGLADLLYV